MSVAHVALGANLGRPLETLAWAVGELARLGTVRGVSGLYRTAPVDGPAGQPDYLNAVLALETTLSPRDLLTALHATEARAGRERRERWGARVLDLDVITYDSVVSGGPEGDGEPALPHPRAWERAFVLVPLADVSPALRHPVSGESVTEALARVSLAGVQREHAPGWPPT